MQRFHVSVHDYPATGAANRLHPKIVSRLRKLLCDLYVAASSRDVISPEMAADLRRNTGIPADAIIRAGLEQEDIERLKTREYSTSNSPDIQLAYAGIVVAEEALVTLIGSLSRLRRKLRRRLVLNLFTNHSYTARSWFSSEWMIPHGYLDPTELRQRMSKMDWGIVAMDLDRRNTAYSQFSLPTKISTYLCSALPIITVGHSQSTATRMAERYHFGVTIDETRVADMDDLLLNELSEDNRRGRFRDKIVRAAEIEFNAPKMRKELYARLGAPNN
jgi:hypothetical protein